MYTLLLHTRQCYEMHYTCAVSALGCFFHKHVNMECAGLHRYMIASDMPNLRCEGGSVYSVIYMSVSCVTVKVGVFPNHVSLVMHEYDLLHKATTTHDVSSVHLQVSLS